jgi:hypothetical protein
MSVERNRSGFDRWIEKQGWLDPRAEAVQGWVLKPYAVRAPGPDQAVPGSSPELTQRPPLVVTRSSAAPGPQVPFS